MGLDGFDSDEWDSIESKVSSLEDDVNRLNNEVNDLKDTIKVSHEKIMDILLSMDKQSLKEETKKGIVDLRDYIADSAHEIVSV